MHESFYSLSNEKQQTIINAAMKVFAQCPYGKASTDDIAAIARISKGSLFYHFKNKRDLYWFLYEYSCKKMYEKIYEKKALDETDFFERNEKIIEARVCAMQEFPYIFDFALRAYYETDTAVADGIKSINNMILKDAYKKLSLNIDTGRFKSKDDINKAVRMLIWIGEGCIKNNMAAGKLNLKDIQAEFYGYMEILKRGFYK